MNVARLLSVSCGCVAATAFAPAGEPPAPVVAGPPTIAATPPTASSSVEVQAALEAMLETDQALRRQIPQVESEHGRNSPELTELWQKQAEIDARNLAQLEDIVVHHGWPRRSEVGERAAMAAFLIVQHADLAVQEKYLPMLREAAAAGEVRGSSLALLEDRINVREGRKQVYGSQVTRNDQGEWVANDLDDPAHVDERRAKVGLPPLAEYLAGFARRAQAGTNAPGERPPAAGAALAQTLFGAADDAPTAAGKLRRVLPRDAGIPFQLACRDFCARFPDSVEYGEVRLMALRFWIFQREIPPAGVEGWDPLAAERDPKLTLDQRATAAMLVATSTGNREPLTDGRSRAEHRFDALVQALPPYRDTKAARQALASAALDAPPEKVLPRLRELYPDDPLMKPCIAALESIGQPCDFKFTALDGRAVDARDYRGKVLMLYFWTNPDTDHAFADKNLAELKTLAQSQASLAIVTVNLNDFRAAAEAAVQRAAVDWPVYQDAQGWHNAIARKFAVSVVPYYLLVDAHGILRARGMNPTGRDTQKRIGELIAEIPSPAPANAKVEEPSPRK